MGCDTQRNQYPCHIPYYFKSIFRTILSFGLSDGRKDITKRRFERLETRKDTIKMTKDEIYLRQAVEIAKQNIEKGGGPFGAIIVKDNEIVAQCGNSVTNDNDPTAHAEVNCIRSACKKLNTFDLSGCVIYSSCEPCPMCLSAIYWARLDRLVYAATRQDAAGAGFDDEFIYKEIPLANSQRSLECNHFSLEDGCDPFEIWNSKSDKTEY